MRNKGLIVVVGLALAGGIYVLLAGRPDGPALDAGPGRVDAVAATAEIVRERLAARERGEVDPSPCSAAGRVVDAGSGRGIEGAVVLLRPRGLGGPVYPGMSDAPITAHTDAGGEWSVPRLVPGRYVLSGSAPGFLPAVRSDLSLASGAANPGLDLALAPGGHALRGTVSDISGGPVEGALLAIDREDEGNVINFSRASIPAVSDAEGRFEVQVASGLYQVSAWHPDYASDSELADVADGPRSVELRLIAAASVEGTVRTIQDDTPVEGAIVSLGEYDESGPPAVVTDAQGRFRLTGLGSGAHRLQAIAAGHASREAAKIELGIGESLTGVEIRVDRAFKISGFVVPKDDPRRALDGVMIAAYALSPPLFQVAHQASEADGYFEIFGVRPGTYALGSVAEEALPEIFGPSVTVADADVTGVIIALERGVELRGRVEPPMLASVTLALADENPGLMAVLGNLANVLVRARADAKGEFRLRPVKPGRMRVVAEAPDGSRGEHEVEIGVDGVDGVVITLEPRATVAGRIVDARGAPLRSGSIEFQPRKRKRKDIFADAPWNKRDRESTPLAEDGTYTARGLAGGDYEVRVLDRAGNVIRWAEDEGTRYRPVRKAISPAVLTAGVDFTVEVRDGVLRGVVLDPDGAPSADAWVTATPERSGAAESRDYRPANDRPAERVGAVPPAAKDGQRAPGDDRDLGEYGEPVLSGEDGRFEFTGLARRTYTLRAESLRGSARVKVAGVEVGSEVRLQVAPLAELSGTTRAGGKPVLRYELLVKHRGGSGFSSPEETVDDPEGAFQLEHLDPGAYVLTALADEGRAVQEVLLRAGETSRVRLDLQPWGRVRGVLIDVRSQAPLAGVNVAAAFGREHHQLGDALDMALGMGHRTNAEGRFDLGKVAPGEGRLSFYEGDVASRHYVAEFDFTVEPGADKDLGTIHGIPAAKVERGERGDLGLRTRVATAASRPRPPGEKAEPPAEKDDPNAPKLLWVQAVTVDGAADKAGLQPGDEIVAIDGRAVAGLGMGNALRLLWSNNLRRGQTVTVEVSRGDSRETFTIEAAERKP